jgi:hypothetical protein
LLATLVGIPLTYWLARRSRGPSAVRYVLDFDVIMTTADGIPQQGLRMISSAAEHEISRIARTRLAVWNAEGDTVHGSDVVDSDPLRLKLASGDVVLNVRTLTASRPQTQLTAEVATVAQPDSVLISFDFLDSGDGGVVEVLHQSSEPPALIGTIRGASVRPARSWGGVSLSTKALFAIAQKGRWKRVTTYLPRRILVPFALMPAMIAVAFVVSLVDVLRKPRLVNPARYDLDTTSGQGRFARKVQAVGAVQYAPLYITLGLTVVMLIAVVLLLFMLGRGAIPSSIVREGDLALSDEEKAALRRRSGR